MRVKLYYGMTKRTDLVAIAQEVCEVLGNGTNGTAVDLLLETCASETGMGQIEDKTKNLANGIQQFDKLPFEDTKLRASKSDKLKIYNYYGINIDWVEWSDLRYNPLLSFIFARLKYKKIPAEIPLLRNERYDYYKKWYNSYLGKATREHFLEMCEVYLDNGFKYA